MSESNHAPGLRGSRVRIALQAKWYALTSTGNRWIVSGFLLLVPIMWYVATTRSARSGDLMSSPMFRMFAIANPVVTTLLPLGAVAIAILAGRSDRLGRRLVLADVRQARRLVARQAVLASVDRADHENAGASRCDTKSTLLALDDVNRKLDEFLWGLLRGNDLRPGDFLSILLADAHDSDTADEHVELLYLMTQEMLAPGHQRIIPKVIYRADVEKIRSTIDSLATLIERDHRGKESLHVDKRHRKFADWVSLFMGSYILADGMAARSGTIARVVVEHRARWKSAGQPPKTTARRSDRRGRGWTEENVSPYAREHRTDRSDSTCTGEASNPLEFRPGDYDGRILSLHAVRTTRNIESGAYMVELATEETCYATTEVNAKLRCKHLASSPEETARAPRCITDETSGEIRIESQATVLLNTAVGVISIDKAGAPTLLLAQRSGHSRNATDVVSATAGGVFEHRRRSGDGDCDDLGVPDPLRSAMRETREELGLGISRSDMVPTAVMLANIQGRPKLSDDGTVRHDNGQLVATVCHLTVTDQTAADIVRQRQLHADWTAGRFELSDIIGIAIPLPASPCESARQTAVDNYCSELRLRAAELDQNAMVSALYAGAHFYGPEAVQRSIRTHFEMPWWSIPWSGNHTGHRLVVDPRTLFGNRVEPITGLDSAWSGRISDEFDRVPVEPDAAVGPHDPDAVLT